MPLGQQFRRQLAIGCQARGRLQRSGFSQKQRVRKPARASQGKARPSVLPIQAAGTEVTGRSAALFFGRSEARSKRSRFITLFHATTKSFTNFSLESAQA